MTIPVSRPIFIVGSPRSGTTVLRSILDAHPSIVCAPWETGIFVALEGVLQRYDEDQRKEPFVFDRSRLIPWVRGTVERLAAEILEAGKTRWAEKTPAHVHHIPLIHQVFPEAQFIHIIRNGYHVVRSLQNMKWSPRGIRWNSKTWVESIRDGRAAARGLPEGLYTELQYEQLIASPETVLRGLCQFLGEPFAPQMLDFHKPEANTWHAARKPLDRANKSKYRELNAFQKFLFRRAAGDLMRELGYEIC